MNGVVGVATAAVAMGLLSGAPASAAECTYTYNDYGHPVWSESCVTAMSPGRVGPLTMGKTTVAQARSMKYLTKNPACASRLEGAGAGANWMRKNGKVLSWTGDVTTKGLRATDSLKTAKATYPGLERTAFLANPFVSGDGWRIYSVAGKAGWLDLYVDKADKTVSWFEVRGKNSRKPLKNMPLDGC
ncbi:MAG: hypothetical protein MUD05_04535 [Candidatus Nanopelagicales bacterium]|jgi:hypothetical protein|nr:hypothetical protein [Candidatus Nanopelagicales bacterium]